MSAHIGASIDGKRDTSATTCTPGTHPKIRTKQVRQALVAALAALGCAILSPAPVSAATAFGGDRTDKRAIWYKPTGAEANRCEGNDNDTQRQLGCVIGIMQSSGASPQAIVFTRRLAAQTGNIGYLSKLTNYGPLALGTVEWPFMENTNAHSDSDFYILNGRPALVAGSTGCADNDPSLASNPSFQRLKRQHPNIMTWEGTVFVSERPLPDGGERFVFSCPLGEYHAAAGEWKAIFALDFDVGENFIGHRLLRISADRAGP
jgi:hypothetical protein